MISNADRGTMEEREMTLTNPFAGVDDDDGDDDIDRDFLFDTRNDHRGDISAHQYAMIYLKNRFFSFNLNLNEEDESSDDATLWPPSSQFPWIAPIIEPFAKRNQRQSIALQRKMKRIDDARPTKDAIMSIDLLFLSIIVGVDLFGWYRTKQQRERENQGLFLFASINKNERRN